MPGALGSCDLVVLDAPDPTVSEVHEDVVRLDVVRLNVARCVYISWLYTMYEPMYRPNKKAALPRDMCLAE